MRTQGGGEVKNRSNFADVNIIVLKDYCSTLTNLKILKLRNIIICSIFGYHCSGGIGNKCLLAEIFSKKGKSLPAPSPLILFSQVAEDFDILIKNQA